MDNEIYEVSRDEYVGFNDQIKPEYKETAIFHLEDCTIIKVISKKTGKHLCTRVIPEEDTEHYYVFNMPDDDERQPGKPVKKIVLETKEEVQTFFDILSKISKENKNG